jgi:uncharacterized protein YbjQ (UPF0145 family)
MALIKQKSNDEWRAKRSQEQLAQGGLPLNAEFRLRRLTESRRLFTSFLSVNELALTASVGVQPLGQVIGSSSFHVGWQNQPYMTSTEMTVLSEAHNRVRRLALSRLQQEAKLLGARAVLGIRLDVQSDIGGHSLLEVSASGTAVTWHDTRPPSLPVLSAVTGQEFSALCRVGYRPVGLAVGASVFYQIGSRQTQQATQNGLFNGAARMNQELTDYTDAFSRTRRRAIHRLEGDAECMKAEGVVGIQVAHRLEVREVEFEYNERKIKRRDLVVYCTAIGTAISSFTDHTPPVFAVMPLGV